MSAVLAMAPAFAAVACYEVGWWTPEGQEGRLWLPYAYPASDACLQKGRTPDEWSAASLYDVLTRSHRKDTWFQAVHWPGRQRWPRLAKSILFDESRDMSTGLAYVVVDLDRPNHTKSPWTSAGEADEAVQETARRLDCSVYATRGGLRAVWVLDRPIPLQLAQSYLNGFHAKLPADLPVDPDKGVKDWTRGFRVPWCPRADKKRAAWEGSAPPMQLERMLDGQRLPWSEADLVNESLVRLTPYDWQITCPHDRNTRRVAGWFKGQLAALQAASSRHAVLIAKARALGGLCRGAVELAREPGQVDPEPFIEALIAATDTTNAARTGRQALDYGAAEPWWFSVDEPFTPTRAQSWRGLHVVRAQEPQPEPPMSEYDSEAVTTLESEPTPVPKSTTSPAQEDAEDRRAFAPTPDGRPYLVAAPGERSGWFIATSDGGFRLVREKLIRIELQRHWPNLETFHPPESKGKPPKPMSTVELFDKHGVSAEAVYYTYTHQTRFQYRPPHTGDMYMRVILGSPPPAVRHADVLEFFEILFGKQFETMLDWFATVPDLSRPTGVPVLIGANSLGKSMVPLGLARYFGESIADYDDVFKERFNDALLRSPIVWLDETTHVEARSGRFRKLTGNDRHAVESKNMPSGTLIGCPRLIVTSNNPDPLKLGREDLTQADEDAIGARIILVDCDIAARGWLEKLGGREYTKDWVSRLDGSPGKIPELIAWLTEQRNVEKGARFLVGGDSAEWAARVATRVGLSATVRDAYEAWVALEPEELERMPEEPFFEDSAYDGFVLVSNQSLRACWVLLLGEKPPNHKNLARALAKLAPAGNERLTLADGRRPNAYRVPKSRLTGARDE